MRRRELADITIEMLRSALADAEHREHAERNAACETEELCEKRLKDAAASHASELESLLEAHKRETDRRDALVHKLQRERDLSACQTRLDILDRHMQVLRSIAPRMEGYAVANNEIQHEISIVAEDIGDTRAKMKRIGEELEKAP
jgi:hypothetical protein